MRELCRRSVLRYLGCGALGIGCRGNDEPKPQEASRPQGGFRYFVHILLSGGHDTVYTTDPKERSEVESWVDLPADNTIVEAGGLRLGAHFAPLARFAPQMSILNGIQTGSANHETGIAQYYRLKTNVVPAMPSLVDIIGRSRDTQASASMSLGALTPQIYSPGHSGSADTFYHGRDALLDRALDARPDDLEALAAAMRSQAKEVAAREAGGGQRRRVGENLESAAAMFEGVARSSDFEDAAGDGDYTERSMASQFRRAAWLLENDLCRALFLDIGLLGWDTHIANAPRQDNMNRALVASLGGFFDFLESTSNAGGTLAEQTVVVAGSDMGRFPRLNGMLGKDHLPQTSLLFYGAGIRGGQVFGGTDKRMEGVAIQRASGGLAGGDHPLVLDDVGATLLVLAGLDPASHGYAGRPLEFLLG